MKKLMAIAFLGLMLTTVLVSCGSKGHANCDAYGGKSANVNHVDNNDIPS